MPNNNRSNLLDQTKIKNNIHQIKMENENGFDFIFRMEFD